MAVVSSAFAGTENPLSEGGVWTPGPGFESNCLKSSGVAINDFASDHTGAVYNNTAGGGTTIGANQYCEVTRTNTASGLWLGVWVRQATDGSGYLFRASSPALGDFRLYKSDSGGTFTQLGSVYGTTPASNDVIRLEISGTTLTPYINGVAQTTQSDATYSSGQPGIYIYQESGSGPDGLTSFEGGDLGSTVQILALVDGGLLNEGLAGGLVVA